MKVKPLLHSMTFNLITDSVAGLITRNDGRYLLQLREDRPSVSYAGWWCLFGGAAEPNESHSQAFQREMLEELCLNINVEPFMTCIYERPLLSPGAAARKTFFEVQIEDAIIGNLTLREGERMEWFEFTDLVGIADRIVPYDLGAIATHRRLKNQAIMSTVGPTF